MIDKIIYFSIEISDNGCYVIEPHVLELLDGYSVVDAELNSEDKSGVLYLVNENK